MLSAFLATVPNKHTQRAYERDVRQFLEWLGGETQLGELKPAELLDYVAHLQEEEYSSTSINRYLSAVRSFLRWASLTERVTATVYSAALVVGNVKKPRTLPRPFTQAEMDRILQQPDLSTEPGARDYAIVQFLYTSGVRLSEALHLNIEDLDFNARQVIVWGKGSKERMATFDAETADALVYYLAYRHSPTRGPLFTNEHGQRISPRGVRARLRELGEQCDLHVHPHKFRRTFAVDALNATRDQDAVRKALGHEDARTTAIYTELAMDGLRDLNAAVTRHRGRRLSDEVASVLSPVRATISVARKEPL